MPFNPLQSPLPLFGIPSTPWNPDLWRTVDDRLRGGASQSYLNLCSDSSAAQETSPPDSNSSANDDTAEPSKALSQFNKTGSLSVDNTLSCSRVCFHGILDTSVLGGAGFASQRREGVWDLSAYGGVDGGLLVKGLKGSGDEMRFALTLGDDWAGEDEDEAEDENQDGQEKGKKPRSRFVWECEFTVTSSSLEQEQGQNLLLKWSDFKKSYRGRDIQEGRGLRLQAIRKIGLLCRSYFGGQQGAFEVEIGSVWVVNGEQEAVHGNDKEELEEEKHEEDKEEKVMEKEKEMDNSLYKERKKGWMSWLFGSCISSKP